MVASRPWQYSVGSILASSNILTRIRYSIYSLYEHLLMTQTSPQLGYWVNEVERMHTTNLWTNPGESDKTNHGIPYSQFSETFTRTFYDWLWEIVQ